MMMTMLGMPAAKKETQAEMLVRALSGQRGLYVQLLALARQQSQFVATGETEQLMEVLSARSRLIEQVGPLDKELQPFKGRWQEVLDGLAAADRAKVAGLLKEVQQLLADILAQDEIDKESLQKQKSEVGVQINRTVTGAALAKAYGRK
jgi:predicted nuclease with TOPRIM domain